MDFGSRSTERHWQNTGVATARPPRILIADDQPDVAEALRFLFKTEGWKVEVVNSPDRALESIRREEFDLLLADLNYSRDTTSGAEGLELVSRVPAVDPTLPIVVMTAWATVDVAVEAMRRGARDFVQKPWENARVLTIARNQVALRRALLAGERLAAATVVDQPRLWLQDRAACQTLTMAAHWFTVALATSR